MSKLIDNERLKLTATATWLNRPATASESPN
jgi:hypothetical protein